MKKQQSIDLIKGKFTPDEAAEILFSIIGDKIKFNNRQLISSELRNTGNLERYKSRLLELRVYETAVLNLVNTARKENRNFEINATIDIKVI